MAGRPKKLTAGENSPRNPHTINVGGILDATGAFGGGTNPAFGADPGNVEVNPDIGKYGTDNPFKPLNWFGTTLNRPDPYSNFQTFLGENSVRTQSARQLGDYNRQADLTQEPLIAAARLKASLSAQDAADAREAVDIASSNSTVANHGALQDFAAKGTDLGPFNIPDNNPVGQVPLTRETLKYFYGPGAMQSGLPAAQLAAVRNTAMLPGAAAQATAGQGADTSASLLATLGSDQSRQFRQSNPEVMQKSLLAAALQPQYSADATRLGNMLSLARLPFAGQEHIKDDTTSVDSNGNVLWRVEPGVKAHTEFQTDPKTGKQVLVQVPASAGTAHKGMVQFPDGSKATRDQSPSPDFQSAFGINYGTPSAAPPPAPSLRPPIAPPVTSRLNPSLSAQPTLPPFYGFANPDAAAGMMPIETTPTPTDAPMLPGMYNRSANPTGRTQGDDVLDWLKKRLTPPTPVYSAF